MPNRRIKGRHRPLVAVFSYRVSTIEEVRALVEETMKVMNVPWYVTQHGIEHVERVVACLMELLTVFRLTKAQAIALIKAAWLHDIGQANFSIPAEATRERHHIDGKRMVLQFIEKGTLRLSEYEEKVVPELVYHHNMFTPLPRDRELRKLVTLLRTADVSDLDRRRVRCNDQGTPFDEVCRRIETELEPEQAKTQLFHWRGHEAISALHLYSSGTDRGAQIHFEFSVENNQKAVHQIGRFQEKVCGLKELCRIVAVEVAMAKA